MSGGYAERGYAADSYERGFRGGSEGVPGRFRGEFRGCFEQLRGGSELVPTLLNFSQRVVQSRTRSDRR
eukprot:13410752-Alexandrium_andersonii.AAC.1